MFRSTVTLYYLQSHALLPYLHAYPNNASVTLQTLLLIDPLLLHRLSTIPKLLHSPLFRPECPKQAS